jgi:hypothetical protein
MEPFARTLRTSLSLNVWQEDAMRKRTAVAFAVAVLLHIFPMWHVWAAEQGRLQQITVNGKNYNWPKARSSWC